MNGEPNNHTDERDYTGGRDAIGRFAKGKWKGGPGKPLGYKGRSTRAMQELILGSMERRGKKRLDGAGDYRTPKEAWIDSLDETLFAKLFEKLLPARLIVDGDGDGGPVPINIIHYGHKPEETEKQE